MTYYSRSVNILLFGLLLWVTILPSIDHTIIIAFSIDMFITATLNMIFNKNALLYYIHKQTNKHTFENRYMI